MSTTQRLVYDDSLYHIIQKGNNGQKIFKDDEDFETFLLLISRYLNKFKVEVYHFCLMPTHIHLLLKIFEKKVLAKFMQGILQSYRFSHKRKYTYEGYLYKGRYRSKLVAKDEYLLECGRYIERNPVRAGITKDPYEYKWSSCSYYTHGRTNGIITEDLLYYTFGNDLRQCQRRYTEYVSMSRPYEEIMDKEFNIQ
ncbi:transposase [Candidatus Omnitrophota bacterium]